MFGNKVVDFNFDSSAFKSIHTLIKNGKQMLECTKGGQQYRLVIMYIVSSERYVMEVKYDRRG